MEELEQVSEEFEFEAAMRRAVKRIPKIGGNKLFVRTGLQPQHQQHQQYTFANVKKPGVDNKESINYEEDDYGILE